MSISALFAKRVTRDYQPITTVFYNFAVGALFLNAFSYPWDKPAAVIGIGEVLAFAYLALFPGVLAFSCTCTR